MTYFTVLSFHLPERKFSASTVGLRNCEPPKRGVRFSSRRLTGLQFEAVCSDLVT